MTELVSQCEQSVSAACRLLGFSRQAYYQSRADAEIMASKEQRLLRSVREIREEDPGIGCYKMWLMMIDMYGEDYVMGRDSFIRLLRHHKLVLPPPKARHTTNSNHRYHKWKNLIRGFVPDAPNLLWVSDITYISTAEGACYLHLITDAYSHKIVGWHFSDTLAASSTIKALEMAISQATEKDGVESLGNLIHHSDRGVQYCCNEYVAMLQRHGILISMTEDYKPTDNAVAERVNGIIKTEVIYRKRQFSNQADALEKIARFIDFYNMSRPHMSIGYKTPASAHEERGEQKRMWNNKKYHKEVNANGKNTVTLQGQTTSRGDSVSRQT